MGQLHGQGFCDSIREGLVLGCAANGLERQHRHVFGPRNGLVEPVESLPHLRQQTNADHQQKPQRGNENLPFIASDPSSRTTSGVIPRGQRSRMRHSALHRAQVHQQIRRGGVTLVRILGQHLGHNAFELGGNLWVQSSERRWDFV